MEIDIPEVRAGLERAFWQYVEAIVANDIATVTAAFWDSESALRYGPGEQIYGKAAIAAFRKTQQGRRLGLAVTRLELTTFGEDFGIANCEMRRSDSDGIGRMSHT